VSYGIAIYVLAYFWALILSMFVNRKTSIGIDLVVIIFAVLPASILAIFRGDVGVDTAIYQLSISNILAGQTSLFEPMFVFLVKFLSYFSDNERIIVRIISFIVVSLLTYLFCNNKRSIIIFLSIIFPIYFYEFTMNTIRVGLALPLIIISFKLFHGNRYLAAIFVSVVSISSHLSTILAGAIQLATKLRVRAIILLSFVSAIMGYMVLEYLTTKYAGYSNFFAPEKKSGTGFLFFSLLSIITFKRFNEIGNGAVGTYVLFSCFAFLITQYTYAGIRLQSLVLFVLMCHLTFFKKDDQFLELKFRLSLILLGLTGFYIFVFRQFVATEGIGLSPFLPYSFIGNL
jgi:hypothetical protein